MNPDDFRLPPQNVEMEGGVIGAILLDNAVAPDVFAILEPGDFWRDDLGKLYGVIREIVGDGGPIDALILDEALRARGLWDRLDAGELIPSVLASVATAANATYHAQIVRQKAVLRRLASACRETLEEVYGGQVSAVESLASAELRIFSIGEAEARGETVPMEDAVGAALDRLDRRMNGGECQGVSTGLELLDRLTDGLQPGQLIVIAARPSIGKTALGLNIAENVAMEVRAGVLFVSLEMNRTEIGDRLIASRAKVDGHRIRIGDITAAERRALERVRTDCRACGRFWVDDTAGRTVSQIAANARRYKLRHGLGLVVVDYVQLIHPADKGESRQEQVAGVSRSLKLMARDLNVPVIALAQLNRNAEKREDKVPQLADLRESGAIEQDADMVVMIHRPEFYDPNDSPGTAKLLVLKNRTGSTGTINVSYLKSYVRFADLAAVHDDGFGPRGVYHPGAN